MPSYGKVLKHLLSLWYLALSQNTFYCLHIPSSLFLTTAECITDPEPLLKDTVEKTVC